LVENTEQKNMTADKRNILTEQNKNAKRTIPPETDGWPRHLPRTLCTWCLHQAVRWRPSVTFRFQIEKTMWLCGRRFLAQTSHVSILISTKMWPCESQFLARAGHVFF